MDEQTLWQQLLQIVAPFAVTAVSVLTTWALYELRKWVKSKTDNEQVLQSLTVLDQVVTATVTQINETVKQVTADGVITEDEAAMLKAKAKQAINDQLPPATRKLLEIWIGQLDDFIDGKIEVGVLQVKALKSEAGLSA